MARKLSQLFVFNVKAGNGALKTSSPPRLFEIDGLRAIALPVQRSIEGCCVMEDECHAVSPKDDKIVIALNDNGGESREIALSFDEASMLAMTLPRLLTMVMSRRSPDVAMQHIYQVRDYIVECAPDQQHVLLTLSSGGGFDVVFGFDMRMVPTLTRDLAGGHALLEMSPSLHPN